MSPGYKTTEFWHALIAQVITLLTLTGVVSSSQGKTLEDAVTACVTAVIALLANGAIVYNYIANRHQLKVVHAVNNAANNADEPKEPAKAPNVLPLILAACGLAYLATPICAQSFYQAQQARPLPQAAD